MNRKDDIYWTDKKFVLEAVKNDGHLLNFASRDLLNDKEIIFQGHKC